MRAFVLALALACATSSIASAQSFEERLSLCLACHGENGTSQTPEVPSLGGQPGMYVLIQLFMFRQNLRTAEPMNDTMKGVTDADLQRFADVIAKLPPPPPLGANPDTARMERAADLVRQHRCAFCHAADFSGNESVPRLAAQREDYLLKSLREYKAGLRTEYQSIMAEVMRPLANQDIVDLAYYLAHWR